MMTSCGREAGAKALRRHSRAPAQAHPARRIRARRPAPVGARPDAGLRGRPSGDPRGDAGPAAAWPARDPSRPARPRRRSLDRPRGRRDRRDDAPLSSPARRRASSTSRRPASSSRWRWCGSPRESAPRAISPGFGRFWRRSGRRAATSSGSSRATAQFHREIAAISGNPIFPALMEAMFKWLAASYRGAVSVPGLEKADAAGARADSRRRSHRGNPENCREAHGRSSEPRERALPHRAFPRRELTGRAAHAIGWPVIRRQARPAP